MKIKCKLYILIIYSYIFYNIFNKVNCSEDDLELLTKTRSSVLEKYLSYINAVVLHFHIPQNTEFASFKFLADEVDLSIFGCDPRNISVYLKYKSLPVINPDHSKFPDDFKNITRSQIYKEIFLSNSKPYYINLTTPLSGIYFITSFISYSDPNHDAIKQQGLRENCLAFLDSYLYIKKLNRTIINNNEEYLVNASNLNNFYKFYLSIPNNYGIVLIKDNSFKEFTIEISSDDVLIVKKTFFNKSEIIIQFEPKINNWHYITFYSLHNKLKDNLTFIIKYFQLKIPHNDVTFPYDNNRMNYNEYNLISKRRAESFSYSFELLKTNKTKIPIALNITNNEMILFKFNLIPYTDTGGIFQFLMAFKPRITIGKNGEKSFEKESHTHIIIGCISNGKKEIPVLPNYCENDGILSIAPIILNGSIDNSSVLIPYPEYGDWYITFKLFCKNNYTIFNKTNCINIFNECLNNCFINCTDNNNCGDCRNDCQSTINCDISDYECNDENCLNINNTCNSTIVFDVSSFPCDCGPNGKCMFMISDGVAYATCVCTNNYRGWSCTDNSFAHPLWQVILELLLLVFSNTMFLPCVYVAFKRKYYVEAIVYLSIFLSSSFYHACDAGENLINFCVTRLVALQFADFFCALLSIWVTLLAIANIPDNYQNICHISGSIILAISTTINKTSLWAFALPTISGLLTSSFCWYKNYRKFGISFININYLKYNLPIGLIVVSVGLIIYTFLQTMNNYKYLHSLWHVIMATSVLILLPKSDTFQSEIRL